MAAGPTDLCPGALIPRVPTDPSAAQSPPPTIDPSAMPFGVAPIAAMPRPRARPGRRRRLIDAAVVTTTLATLPLAGALSRGDSAPPTLVTAVSGAEDAQHAPGVRSSLAELGAMAPLAPAGPAQAQAAAVDEGIRPVAAATPVLAPTPIAAAGGVELLVPSTRSVLVGFHEAAIAGTEEMTVLAPLAADHAATEVATASDPHRRQVAPVIALPTRGRAQAPTSAIDVAIPEGEDVLAPVSGTVVMAAPYTLYGQYGDVRVEIQPDGAPDTRVIMIHMDDVAVDVGDRVEAGSSVIAGSAKTFPFASQIDRFSTELTGSAHPHVHLEIKQPA
jgi:murein DD-endopeptidase MepM/ murein hydrolase activator NlpD